MSVCPHRRRRHRATGQAGQPRHPVAPPATRLHHAVLPPCGGVVRVATVSPVGALVVRRRVDCAGDMSAARERERAQLPRRFVALPPAISCERPTSHPLAATRLSYGSCTAGGPSWMTPPPRRVLAGHAAVQSDRRDAGRCKLVILDTPWRLRGKQGECASSEPI